MTKSQRSITIRHVAEKANVSVATVSRYLNQNAPVSEQVASRIEQAMIELKYVPNSIARKLATTRTETVGLILAELIGDYFAPLLNGVEATTSKFGFDLLISSTRQPHKRKGLFSPLGPQNVDGIMVFAHSLDSRALAELYQRDFPIVLIHYSSPEGMQIPCVTVENKSAACKIVEHLITAHGRRRIVFLRGAEGHEDSYWRELGYQEALRNFGIPLDTSLIAQGGFNRHVAANSIRQLLQSATTFDGVFAGDDEAAVGVLTALNEFGYQVPQDISVVGFDDQRMAPYLVPPLTTVRAPTEEVGTVAATKLIDLIQGREVEPLTLLPTQIIIRRSCGCNQPS